MRLLLVEDEPKLVKLLRRGLAEEGHAVDAVTTGTDALEQATRIAYDVVVLDWGLPELDGLSVLRALRARGVNTPVLLLTARGSVGERVTGLRAGADDYLVKPFSFEELLARIEALHRRSSGHELARKLGDLDVDRVRRTLSGASGEVSLTAREFALFAALAGHLGDAITRTELLASVWGPDFDGEPNVVDVYVGYVRNKLAQTGAKQLAIETVRGVGYRLRLEGG